MQAGENRRVAITGATGLIGSVLLPQLIERGYELTALVRNPQRDRAKIPAAVSLVEWKATATEGPWCDAVAEADIVINLAGAPVAQRWNEPAKMAIVESRVDGTEGIVAAMNGGPTRSGRVLINASGVGFYGAYAFAPSDEETDSGNDFIAEVCAAWEEATKRADRSIRVVLLRTGIVLSPEGGALVELLTPFRLGFGGPIAGGRQPFPWVHLDDEIGAILHLIDNDEATGPYNVVAPQQTTNRTFARTLGSVLRRPSFLPIPAFVIRLIIGDAAVTVVGGQNAVPSRTLASGYRFAFPDLEGALKDLLEKK